MPRIAMTRSLADVWGRKLPDRLSGFLSPAALAKLEKRSFTLRYAGAGNPSVHPIFLSGITDLAAWMEDVGLGDDIDWPKEKAAGYRRHIPLALIAEGKADRKLAQCLLVVDTKDAQCPVRLWVEGHFIDLFDSLDGFVGELTGAVADPIELLTKAVAQADKLAATDRAAAAETIESALRPLEGLLGKTGEDVPRELRQALATACTDAGFHRHGLGDRAAAERHYTVAAAMWSQAAEVNLMRMAAEDKDWNLVVQRCAKLAGGTLAPALRRTVEGHQILGHAMGGNVEEALAVLARIGKRDIANDDFASGLAEVRAGLGAEAPAPVVAAIDALVGTWTAARAPRQQTDREWWDGLEDAWRAVLCRQDGSMPARPDDQQLAAIVRLTTIEVAKGGRMVPSSLAPLTRLAALSEFTACGGWPPGNTAYALAPLATLTRLAVLSLEGTEVTDLSPLAGHPAITTLSIKGTQVADVTAVGTLAKLRSFTCWGAPVADLAPLDSCPELEELVAARTPATELPLFPGLGKLRRLCILYSRFTKKQVAAFKRQHPGCEVEYSEARD